MENKIEKSSKDLEFYTQALHFQSYLVNRVAIIIDCKWDNEFSMKELKEGFEKYRNDKDVKRIFDINNLTKERARALRFQYWDKEQYPNLMLFPLWFALLLPYGTEVISIDGSKFKYSEDTDLDIRYGCVGFGINIEK